LIAENILSSIAQMQLCVLYLINLTKRYRELKNWIVQCVYARPVLKKWMDGFVRLQNRWSRSEWSLCYCCCKYVHCIFLRKLENVVLPNLWIYHVLYVQKSSVRRWYSKGDLYCNWKKTCLCIYQLLKRNC